MLDTLISAGLTAAVLVAAAGLTILKRKLLEISGTCRKKSADLQKEKL